MDHEAYGKGFWWLAGNVKQWGNQNGLWKVNPGILTHIVYIKFYSKLY